MADSARTRRLMRRAVLAIALIAVCGAGSIVVAGANKQQTTFSDSGGLTPVIISNSIEWLSLDDWKNERSALNNKIDDWRSDGESKEVSRYLKHYSKNLKTRDQRLDPFAQQKRKVNAGKEWIKVKRTNLSMYRDPGKEELVLVTFEQDYQSNNLNNPMKKRQYWIREEGTWKIIFEGAA